VCSEQEKSSWTQKDPALAGFRKVGKKNLKHKKETLEAREGTKRRESAKPPGCCKRQESDRLRKIKPNPLMQTPHS